jgi:hypothetical protein
MPARDSRSRKTVALDGGKNRTAATRPAFPLAWSKMAAALGLGLMGEGRERQALRLLQQIVRASLHDGLPVLPAGHSPCHDNSQRGRVRYDMRAAGSAFNNGANTKVGG